MTAPATVAFVIAAALATINLAMCYFVYLALTHRGHSDYRHVPGLG